MEFRAATEKEYTSEPTFNQLHIVVCLYLILNIMNSSPYPMRAGATRAAMAHQRAGSMTRSAGADLFMARRH